VSNQPGGLACPDGSAKPEQMAQVGSEKACCARTRQRWLKRIALYFTAFPVIKDVPCDTCREILEIRVYSQPAA